ncbi:hypothetical protein FRC03_007319 [Tulasnella sp. 419]|nr:hypothetical protein FRC03_007319 [Tulasnella sp. 419]
MSLTNQASRILLEMPHRLFDHSPKLTDTIWNISNPGYGSSEAYKSTTSHRWPYAPIIENDDKEFDERIDRHDQSNNYALHPWLGKPSRLSEAPGNWSLGQIESLKQNTNLMLAAQQTSRLQLVRGNVIRMGQEPVRRGSYGSVWKGKLLSLSQLHPWRWSVLEVTIKVINVEDEDDDRLLKRLFREVVPLCNIPPHPNILQVKGYLLEKNCAWIISAWQGQGNALQYLQSNSAVDKLKLISEVVEGLCYLHSHEPPIVHGDLKPDNVLINDDRSAMLTDFGLSRIMDESTGAGFVTSTFIRGSLYFLAPELLAGERRTPRSDIWGLGGLILQIATGKRPFHGMEPHCVLASLYKKEIPITSIDTSFTYATLLLPIIQGCWNINPES